MINEKNMIGQAVQEPQCDSPVGLGIDYEQATRWLEAYQAELLTRIAQQDEELRELRRQGCNLRAHFAVTEREKAVLKRQLAAEHASHASTLRQLDRLCKVFNTPEQSKAISQEDLKALADRQAKEQARPGASKKDRLDF